MQRLERPTPQVRRAMSHTPARRREDDRAHMALCGPRGESGSLRVVPGSKSNPGLHRDPRESRGRLKAVIVLALAAFAPAACDSASGTAWTEPTTGMEFVLVRAGAFVMGSPDGEAGRGGDETQHRVEITHDFYLGRHEVTQREWAKVMGSNPSHFRQCGNDCPVESVSWRTAQQFIAKLNAMSKGAPLRLPTEAEWEYSCRAGTQTPFNTGENLTTDQANYDGNHPYKGHSPGRFLERPSPVGAFPPNDWGLHDMHGNVWEWCQDDYCPYPDGDAKDPVARCGGLERVIRGGSWYFNAESARSALRYTHAPGDSGFSLGLRLARTAERP